jgi:hypothetical protein
MQLLVRHIMSVRVCCAHNFSAIRASPYAVLYALCTLRSGCLMQGIWAEGVSHVYHALHMA